MLIRHILAENMDHSNDARAVLELKAALLDKPTPTVGDLAEKYKCSLLMVQIELKRGIKVEMEHTTKVKVAREIALDHLNEDLHYYEKLAKAEKVNEDQSIDEDYQDVIRAARYAATAHKGQKRSGGKPYIGHPVRVANIVKNHVANIMKDHEGGSSELNELLSADEINELLAGAFLHDTIEDTDTDEEQLRKMFGALVASLVKELTSDKDEIAKVGKTEYLARKMTKMSSWALVIKLADRLDNVSDIKVAKDAKWRHRYRTETETILDRIEQDRKLSDTHRQLIRLIRAKLAELDESAVNEADVEANDWKKVVDEIRRSLPIAQEIWLHGSRATGKHRKNSDTDILVVVPNDMIGDKYLTVVEILQKLSAQFDNYDIQPTMIGNNIYRIAQEEGKLLWSNTNENFADGKGPRNSTVTRETNSITEDGTDDIETIIDIARHGFSRNYDVENILNNILRAGFTINDDPELKKVINDNRPTIAKYIKDILGEHGLGELDIRLRITYGLLKEIGLHLPDPILSKLLTKAIVPYKGELRELIDDGDLWFLLDMMENFMKWGIKVNIVDFNDTNTKTTIMKQILASIKNDDTDNIGQIIAHLRANGVDWPELAVIERSMRADKKISENFADGKGPGKPGDSARHGIPKGATIAQLEKAAKAPGRKGQLARWQLNMRRGKAKR